MYEIGKHIDDQSTGARLVIEAVEKDHLLCKVERRPKEKQRTCARQNSRRAVGSAKA